MVTYAGFSAEDREFLETITNFVNTEVVPVVRERDNADEYPDDLVDRMRELNVFRASERPLPVYAMMIEEIARGWVSMMPIVNAHCSALWVVRHNGTEVQKERWVEEMSAGRKLCAYGLTEPTGGSDLSGITSTATKVEGGWRIDARKAFITHTRHADLMLLLVKTDPTAQPPHRGMSLFMLERGEWEVIRDMPKTGSRAVETTELVVDGVIVPDDRIIGGEVGQGFAQIMNSLEIGRIAVAAGAVGLSRAALWYAIEYSRTREAFGNPISDFQGLRFELADIATKIAGARQMMLACAELKERGGRYDLESSMAKLYASETAAEAALQSVRTLGGYGFLKDHDTDRYYRDAPIYIVGEGTNGLLKSLIGKRLIEGETSLNWI